MATIYLALKAIHVIAVLLSIALFTTRGALVLAGQRQWAMSTLPRRGSQVIDSVLLLAALCLAVLLGQYPFVHGWLTAKLVLLVVYIGFGMLALHGERTRTQRALWFASALLTFAAIVAIARFRHPLGPLLPLLS